MGFDLSGETWFCLYKDFLLMDLEEHIKAGSLEITAQFRLGFWKAKMDLIPGRNPLP